ncbi:venom serine protease [Eurytemora carolleeae]|uniref:venom serine protease n=1 Tax=Eurytemora carolleeae TaxID=1294199 RepID=UPI000C775967|nr:venom serine protease [Eurytemora carolleeae]|eukprot:XP_023344730.1 venom serine protease-like [Eurytemora affinis]
MNRGMSGSFESKNHEMNRGMPGSFESKNLEMNRGMPRSFESKNLEINRGMPGSFESKNLEMNRGMPGSIESKNLEINRGMRGSFESKNLEINRGMPESFETKNLEVNRGMLGSFESKNLEMNRGMKCACGLEWGEERISDSNRIIGGVETLDGQYPWLVRIYGGCARQYCTGSLISDRHILTSYHCLKISKTKTPCDHSDGERKALIGTNTFERKNPNGISLKKYYFPGIAGIDLQDLNSTDLAIYELETTVQFNSSVLPVCLPQSGTKDYTGLEAISAGWGDYRVGRNTNSKVLRSVSLTVAPPIQHHTLFSTITEKNEDGLYKDPCAGDSGGPLMLKNKENKFQIIGTVQGGGYDCDRAGLVKTFGDENQKWNKVGIYLDWIKEVLSNSTDTHICS